MQPAQPEAAGHGSRRDAGVFRPRLVLQPSMLWQALLATTGLCALIAAWFSYLPVLPTLLLLLATLLALGWAARRESRRRGLLIELVDDQSRQFRLRHADGGCEEGVYAGHALFGSLAVFLYLERAGARRFQRRRIAVLRDAVSAEEFRRLRAWVRLS